MRERIRRVRAFEAHFLKKLNSQRMAQRVFGNFERHEQWVDHAVRDVESGRRIAFGAFRSVGERHSETDICPLLASVILKKGSYTNEVEIKNLLLADDVDIASNRGKELVRQLIEVTRQFCEFRGFSKQTVELPVDAVEYVSSHLAHDFYIEALRPSPYDRRTKMYILARDLAQPYVGDPFDLVAFVSWVLTNLFQFRLENPSVELNDMTDGFEQTAIYFRLQGSLQRHKPARGKLDLTGCCYISEQDTAKQILATLRQYSLETDIRILVSARDFDSVRRYCKTRRIKFLHASELAELSGKGCLVNQLPAIPKAEDVGGLLVEAGDAVYQQLKQWEWDLTYVLPNGHGLSLRDSVGDEGSDCLVLFALHNTPDSGETEIHIGAVAKVRLTEGCSIENAWEKMGDRPRFWTRQEYSYFFSTFHANQEVQGRVALLHLRSVKHCDPPIPLKTLLDDADRDTIYDIWFSKHLTDCYFGNKSRAKIIQILESQESPFKTSKQTLGGLYMRALVTALETTSGRGHSNLGLLERVRHQFTAGDWKKLESGTVHPLPEFLVEQSLEELVPLLEKMCLGAKDPKFDTTEKREYKKRCAHQALEVLRPVLTMASLSEEMRQLLCDLKEYFDTVTDAYRDHSGGLTPLLS